MHHDQLAEDPRDGEDEQRHGREVEEHVRQRAERLVGQVQRDQDERSGQDEQEESADRPEALAHLRLHQSARSGIEAHVQRRARGQHPHADDRPDRGEDQQELNGAHTH